MERWSWAARRGVGQAGRWVGYRLRCRTGGGADNPLLTEKSCRAGAWRRGCVRTVAGLGSVSALVRVGRRCGGRPVRRGRAPISTWGDVINPGVPEKQAGGRGAGVGILSHVRSAFSQPRCRNGSAGQAAALPARGWRKNGRAAFGAACQNFFESPQRLAAQYPVHGSNRVGMDKRVYYFFSDGGTVVMRKCLLRRGLLISSSLLPEAYPFSSGSRTTAAARGRGEMILQTGGVPQ